MSHRRAANWGGDLVSLGTAALEAGDRARAEGRSSILGWPGNGYRGLANIALNVQPPHDHLPAKKVRFLPLRVAVCTYAMRRVGAFHRFLERVENAAVPVGLKRIAFGLRRPALKLHNFFFQRALAANHIRMVALERHHSALRRDDLRLKRD